MYTDYLCTVTTLSTRESIFLVLTMRFGSVSLLITSTLVFHSSVLYDLKLASFAALLTLPKCFYLLFAQLSTS